MTKLPLALAALAVVVASPVALSTSADAGGRGHFRFHHFHFSPPLPVPEPTYVRRRPRVVKPVAASTRAPVVKYADGEGRQYDRISKTWFDGTDSCWKGSKGFAYRSGSWFYGTARWVQTSSGWGVSSGDLPERVDCAGVKAFAGKFKPTTAAATSPLSESPKPDVVKQTSARTVAPTPVAAETKAPDTTANASDCKKYLPSLGETVSVPCTQ